MGKTFDELVAKVGPLPTTALASAEPRCGGMVAMKDLYEVEVFSKRLGWRRTGTVFASWKAGAKWLARAKRPDKWRLVPLTMESR